MNAYIAIAVLVALLVLAVVVDMTIENWGRLVTGRRRPPAPPTRTTQDPAGVFTTAAQGSRAQPSTSEESSTV